MKRLLTVTFFTGLLTLFKMIAGFIVAKVVAIYTGPSGIVMLGQIQSIVTGLNGLVNSPAGPGIVRYTAENIKNGPEACAPWWCASLRWIIIILSITVPVMLIASPYLAKFVFGNQEYTWIILITVILLPFSAVGTFISSVINGMQKYKTFVMLGVLSTLISTVAMVALVYTHGVNGALLAIAVQNAIIGIIMIAFLLRQKWFNWKFIWFYNERAKFKDIRNYILMAITSAVVTPVSLILVRNIIISNVGWNEAGYWQAIWKISETYLMIITIALGTYVLPRLSALKENKAIYKEINSSFVIIFPITIVCSLFIYFMRDVIISLLFTGDFYLARDLIPYQLIGDILKISSWLYAYVMISKGMTKIFVISELFFALSFTVLVYFLVRSYGVIGAPMAYIINYFFYFLFSISLVFKGKENQ